MACHNLHSYRNFNLLELGNDHFELYFVNVFSEVKFYRVWKLTEPLECFRLCPKGMKGHCRVYY